MSIVTLTGDEIHCENNFQSGKLYPWDPVIRPVNNPWIEHGKIMTFKTRAEVICAGFLTPSIRTSRR